MSRQPRDAGDDGEEADVGGRRQPGEAEPPRPTVSACNGRSAKFQQIWVALKNSAVSAPIFASKYAFFSIFQDLPYFLAEFVEILQNFANDYLQDLPIF